MEHVAPSLPTEVYELLKKKIINFDLMPGQLLIVQDVAKELDISRTPVREAMVRLRSEGLLADSTGRKFRVSNISWEFISDLYAARKMLEGYAVEQLARAMPQNFLEQMDASIRQLQQGLRENNYDLVFYGDMEFHRLITDACGNIVIREWVESLYDRQMRVRFLTMAVQNRPQATLEEHTKIYQAFCQKNFAAAKRLLEQHLQNTPDALEALRNDKMSIVSAVVK